MLFKTLWAIPSDKDIYIYTNGLLINNEDIGNLLRFRHFKGLNIGLHSLKQLKNINKNVDLLPVRFLARDIYIESLLIKYPDQLSLQNLKGWKLNECERPNEDWVLLIK